MCVSGAPSGLTVVYLATVADLVKKAKGFLQLGQIEVGSCSTKNQQHQTLTESMDPPFAGFCMAVWSTPGFDNSFSTSTK